MTELAAFKGTIGALRTIGGRKVIAVTIEVPIEHQQTVAKIAEHGAWVAVARLAEGDAPVLAEKPKRSWADLSVAEQAGIRCNEGRFASFLAKKMDANPKGITRQAYDTPEQVASALRQYFSVKSRRDITRYQWEVLNEEYRLWLQT
ncbi:MAG: hypothetical protein KIT15_16920 [Xanthobacteraceae bacterium]|nr:hypothetical protein [Xanthobacteraceae bacterium]